MRHEASGLKLLVYEALSLSYAGWRAAFFVEGLAMLPVAALCFLVTNGLKSQVAPRAFKASYTRSLRPHTLVAQGLIH